MLDSSMSGTKQKKIKVSDKHLLQEIYLGGVLIRLDQSGMSSDRNYWRGEEATYSQEPRSTADRLVKLGLAQWEEDVYKARGARLKLTCSGKEYVINHLLTPCKSGTNKDGTTKTQIHQ